MSCLLAFQERAAGRTHVGRGLEYDGMKPESGYGG